MINYLFQEQNWQSQLSDLITDPEELISLLELSSQQLTHAAILANKQFKLRVPRQFVDKMQVGNPFDPLLLQVLPHHLESQEMAGFSLDPLGEQHSSSQPGILHKYKSRVLLTLTGACAIHCRYCFRRHFPYQDNLPKEKDWLAIKHYLMAHPEVNEIILSGGDPLSLSNAKLARWFDYFQQLPQIKTLRIHSRLPVVIPQRIDPEFLAMLQHSPLRIVMVVHSNHAHELDTAFNLAMAQLLAHDVLLLNQSVLLKAINDDFSILTNLSYRLFAARVLPYYLHVLDKVKGASHFLISDQEAITIYHSLLKELPGYLLPKLVRETHGELHKTPLNIF
jgi:EF-P beta-lysylation protein EpmB